jgi:hypothetical protein
VQWLKVHPFFDPLRGDPRFAAFLHRGNFQQPNDRYPSSRAAQARDSRTPRTLGPGKHSHVSTTIL